VTILLPFCIYIFLKERNCEIEKREWVLCSSVEGAEPRFLKLWISVTFIRAEHLPFLDVPPSLFAPHACLLQVKKSSNVLLHHLSWFTYVYGCCMCTCVWLYGSMYGSMYGCMHTYICIYVCMYGYMCVSILCFF
jgi:hypothetical protein